MSQNEQRRVFVAQPENGSLTDTDILQVLSAVEIGLATVSIVKQSDEIGAMTEQDAVVLILQRPLQSEEQQLSSIAVRLTAHGIVSRPDNGESSRESKKGNLPLC